MATWHGTIAGAMNEAAMDMILLAREFRRGELDASETRTKLAAIQSIVSDCSESLRRLAEQEGS